MYEAYNSKNYHAALGRVPVKSGISRRCSRPAEFGYLLGMDIANQEKLPDWRPGDQFHR